MAIIHDLINLGHCGQSAIEGTSNDFCVLDISRIKKYLRLPYGYKFASDFVPTQEAFNLLIQNGVMTPIYKIVDATFTTEANGIQTFGGGNKKLIEKMPLQIDGKMINGVQGYQNTLSVEKSPAHSFLIVDVNNNIFGYKGKDGQFRGINSEFFNVGAYMGAGSESASYMVQIQLDRAQFDTGLGALRNEDYDFDIDEIKGFTNLTITIPTAPTTGGTSFSFKVVRKEDLTPQLGFANTELAVYIDGVAEVSPTIGAPTAEGLYTVTGLTAFTLGQVIQVETNDGTYRIVDLDGTLMKSNVADTIVVAP